MDTKRLYELRCGVQHYPWGRRARDGKPPYIAELTGQPATDEPFAELWIGAHPKLPAQVILEQDSPALDAVIAADQQGILGPALLKAGVTQLPFLLKVLSCEKPLSIQAHPDLDLAKQLHDRDPEHYPDANHKPEIAIGLTPFRALCQFRARLDIRADLERVPCLQAFFADDLESPNDWLRAAYARVFTAEDGPIADLLRDTASAVEDADVRSPEDSCYLNLLKHYPGDRGALSAYFLNYVELNPGEALFLAADEPHCYIDGTIVECMASSDNVVRAGLTPKFIDRPVLLDMLTYRDGPPPIQHASTPSPGCRRYTVPVPEFQVEFQECGQDASLAMGSNGTVSILLVLEGSASLKPKGREPVAAGRGSTWLWPADCAELEVTGLSPGTTIVRAAPNLDQLAAEGN